MAVAVTKPMFLNQTALGIYQQRIKYPQESSKTQEPMRISETIMIKGKPRMLLICLLMGLNQAVQAQLHGDITRYM